MGPPLLNKRKRRQLLGNFHYLDREGKGRILYTDLVEAGFVDVEMMHELMAQYDKDEDGSHDPEEFLEMLCPFGCRARESVTKVVDKKGRGMTLVVRDSEVDVFRGWLLDADLERLGLAGMWTPPGGSE